MTMTDQMPAVMEEIRELATTRKHHLAPHMTGQRSLTAVQAGLVLEHLRKCPPLTLPPAVASPEAEPERSNVPPPLSAFKGKIPAGYYATPGTSQEIDFWKVDGGKGKWEGFAFPRRVLGGNAMAGEEMRTVDLSNMQQRLALQAITVFGLERAGGLFAERLTRCRDCGRFLTDEASRADGRGPICRARH